MEEGGDCPSLSFLQSVPINPVIPSKKRRYQNSAKLVVTGSFQRLLSDTPLEQP
jgi:hypothetical protein